MSTPKEGSRDTGQGDDANTASTVRMTGKRARNMGSVVTWAQGDAPGIAGGRYDSVVDKSLSIEGRMGGLRENSSMGRQWRHNRAQRLEDHAREQAANNCPSVQVDLKLCRSVPGEPGAPR